MAEFADVGYTGFQTSLQTIAESLAGLARPREMYGDTLFSEWVLCLRSVLVFGSIVEQTVPCGESQCELVIRVSTSRKPGNAAERYIPENSDYSTSRLF